MISLPFLQALSDALIAHGFDVVIGHSGNIDPSYAIEWSATSNAHTTEHAYLLMTLVESDFEESPKVETGIVTLDGLFNSFLQIESSINNEEPLVSTLPNVFAIHHLDLIVAHVSHWFTRQESN